MAAGSTPYTVSSFRVDMKFLDDAINELALLGRTATNKLYDWEVNASRTFYYFLPSEDVTKFLLVGRDLKSFEVKKDTSQMRNALWLTGSVGDGQQVNGWFTDATSISTYRRIDGTLNLSGMVNLTELTRAGVNQLIRSAFPLNRCTIEIPPLANGLPRTDITTRDRVKCFNFSDGTSFTENVERISYTWDERGLSQRIELGANAPTMADVFVGAAQGKARQETSTDQGRYKQPQAFGATDTGGADAYVSALNKAPSSYYTGLRASFVPANNNTGASTVNLSSLGAQTIVRSDGTPLEAGDIQANSVVDLVYDGTNFRLQAGGGMATNAAAWGGISGTLSDQTDLQTALDAKVDESLGTAKGDIIAFTASGVPARRGVGTNGQILTADSVEADGVKWANAPASSPLTTKGDIYGYSTTNARIPVGTNGQVLQADSTQTLGVKWADPTSGGYTTTFTNGNLAAGVLTVTHNLGVQLVHVSIRDNANKKITPDDITYTSATACAVDLTNFGTLTGTWAVTVGVGGNTTPAAHASTHSSGGADPVTLDNLAGTLAISKGGTGQTSQTAAFDALAPTTTKGDVIVANGTDNIRLAVGTNGQVLTADSTQASGVKWAAAAGGGLTWNEVTGISQAMSVNNGYAANNAALVTLTLPSTAAVGDVIEVAGVGAGGWKIAQNAGQQIHYSTLSSTSGTGGYLASTHRRDCVRLLCVVTNNEFDVLGGSGSVEVA